MNALVLGLGLGLGLGWYRTLPVLDPAPRGAFVLFALLAVLVAWSAGRGRRRVPVAVSASAIATASAAASSTGNAVHVTLVTGAAGAGGGVLDQLDTVSWRHGPAVSAEQIVAGELAELSDDAADRYDPAELLELSPAEREDLR